MNNDILPSATANCTDTVPVDALQLPSTGPRAESLGFSSLVAEEKMNSAKDKLFTLLCISSERAWRRYCEFEYKDFRIRTYGINAEIDSDEGLSARAKRERALWTEFFKMAERCGHDISADIAEEKACQAADRKIEGQRREAEAKRKREEQQRWRDENPEAYAEQLKQQELARQQLEGSTAQPQKQKRGKRGKDRNQRTTNPKAWINDIAQLGFKSVQLQIALHIIGLCRKQHDQGKGGCGINRKRVQERYQRSLRTVEVVIKRLRDAGVITVERAKPQLKQKYGEQYGQFGKTSLTEAFRNGTWQPQPQADSTAASEPKTAAKAAVRTIFSKKIWKS